MAKKFEMFLSRAALLALCLLYSTTAAADSLIRVVVYGDSLTSGFQLQPEQAFPARLERKIREYGFDNVQVINMSVPGETTAGGIERINSVLVLHPDIVVVELGANDTLRGIRPDLIYKNLATMLSQLMAQRAYIVLVGIRAPANLGTDYASQLDNGYRSLASTYHAALYPFALDGVYGRQDLSLADGIHPNAQGVQVMAERIYPLVDTAVRWKEQVIQYEQKKQEQQGLPLPPDPLPTTPAP